MRNFWFGVCISLVFCTAVYASTPVPIQDDFSHRHLGLDLEYLEDPAGDLTYPDIQSPTFARRFAFGRDEVPNFGIADSAYWVKFSVSNETDQTKEVLLAVGMALTHSIDVYLRHEDGRLVHKQGGTSISPDQREIYHRDHLFRLILKPQETVDVALHMKTVGAMLMDLSIWNPETFWQEDRRLNWLIGLSVGGFVILALYHLLLYISVRDRLYIYFVFFLISYSIYILSLEGVAAQYLWPHWTWWAGHCTVFLSGLAILAGVLFVRAYLQSWESFPRLDRFLFGLALFSLAAGLSGFVDYLFGNYATILAGLLALTVLPVVILYHWHRGLRLALNFFLAWLAFFACGIFYILTITGSIKAYGSTFRSLAVGFILGGILLAYVVGQRINDVMRRNQDELERKVIKQTASLKETLNAMKVEVQERLRAERALEYRVDLVQLISHLSTMFINLKSSDIDDGIHRALQVIGRFLDVDRSYVYLLSNDKQSFRNSHEWAGEGIESYDEKVPIEAAPWWMSKLEKMETIYISSAEDLPPEAASEKEAMIRQKIQSLLVVPLVHEGDLVGFLGFDAIRERRTWREEEIALLDTVGMIVVNATTRKWAEEELARYREHLEELVAERTEELIVVNQRLQKDILERKRAEAEKEKLEEQLRQSQKMEAIGRLAGGIAHDFNNILTGIIGYSDMILKTIGAENSLFPDLEEIKRAAERAATLTAQLLAFSRKQIILPETINLGDVVAHSQNMLARIIGEDIELHVKRQENLWSIHADPNQMEQVLINLAVNARDAMPGGGKLAIGLANIERTEPAIHRDEEIPPGEYVQLSVQDNGCGMDDEVLNHIFEPFFSTKSKDKGSGLGLATVYGIVKQNQGFIYVESEVGEGTTITINLPRKLETKQPVDDSRGWKDPAGPVIVLLVADETRVPPFVRQVLEAEGFRVLHVDDGYEAIQACKECEEPIKLLVADSELNRGEGSTIYDQIRKNHPGLKAVFFAETDEEETPGDHISFVRNPFSAESFRRIVQQVMEA